jgi:hypothetical protein
VEFAKKENKMEKNNLETLKIKSDQLAAELAENDAANAVENAAICGLLAAVISIAKPAIRAIGHDLRDEHDQDFVVAKRAINLSRAICHTAYNGDRLLCSDGSVRTVVVDCTRSGEFEIDRGVGRLVDFSGVLSTYEAKYATEKIIDLIERAGSRADATKAAILRAEKFRAITALLSNKK